MSIHFGMKRVAFPLLEGAVPHFIANSFHEEQAIMEERFANAFAGTEQFTAMGRQLQGGDPAPNASVSASRRGMMVSCYETAEAKEYCLT